jgi:hypothetical protein
MLGYTHGENAAEWEEQHMISADGERDFLSYEKILRGFGGEQPPFSSARHARVRILTDRVRFSHRRPCWSYHYPLS